MDSLNRNGKKKQIVEGQQNQGFCDKTFPLSSRSWVNLKPLKNQSRANHNHSPTGAASTKQIVYVHEKLRRKQRRQNEIETLQTKFQRPLNSVEIDKLYKGYRKIDKCTKRKSCQCYHCELLRSSSDDANYLSSEASDTSSGGEASKSETSLLQCFKFMSGVRDAKILPQFHYTSTSFKSPRFELASNVENNKVPLCGNSSHSFSNSNEKTQSSFWSCTTNVVVSILLSIVYAVRWMCIIIATSVGDIWKKFCKRRSRRIHPYIGKKYPVVFDENKRVTRVDADGDNGETLVSISVHNPP